MTSQKVYAGGTNVNVLRGNGVGIGQKRNNFASLFTQFSPKYFHN